MKIYVLLLKKGHISRLSVKTEQEKVHWLSSSSLYCFLMQELSAAVPKWLGMCLKKKAAVSGFPITVYEALNSYRIVRKCRDKSIIDRILADVRLLEHKHARIGTLSGGQLQKMYIARALIGEPDLLILDEPSTGIDIQSQHEIYAYIKKLNTESGLTVVSVEHNLDAAVLNSTDIFHLANGCGHLCTPQKYAAEFLHFRRQVYSG